jgi:hypothetical protein
VKFVSSHYENFADVAGGAVKSKPRY